MVRCLVYFHQKNIFEYLNEPNMMAHVAVCDGTQNVKRYRYFFPVPNISDTDTVTFFGTKFFRYWFRDFFPIPNFTDISSETFFRYQFVPIPVPRLFPVLICSNTTKKIENSRYREFPVPVRHTLMRRIG